MLFGDVIMSGDIILQCFVLCCKIDKKKDVLCLGTMKGRGHNKLQIKTKLKLSKRCYLYPEMHSRLLGSSSFSRFYPFNCRCHFFCSQNYLLPEMYHFVCVTSQCLYRISVSIADNRTLIFSLLGVFV